MMDRQFQAVFLKLYVLWRASKGEVYGLQILEEMRELGFKISPGTLYPTLHVLLQERDVTMNGRRVNGKLRKCYRATAKGRKEAREVVERFTRLLERVSR
jgi:DNA-binding PadR family transcriptional regulator